MIRSLLYLANVSYLASGGMMAEHLWSKDRIRQQVDAVKDKCKRDGILNSNFVVARVAKVAEFIAEDYEAAIAERDATIERLRAALAEEQARTICYACGKELAEMAKVTPANE